MTAAQKKGGLDLLREPFPAHQISKLPKPTKKQTDDVRADFKKGIRCTICGAWHHPDVVHLDYVGHAALTDRLLDCDAYWFWEPMAVGPDGLPALDKIGGLWIKLTVCGHARLGYGHAEGKDGGDAIKEVIGDALRNAAMRFGAALDLWHKGDLHVEDDDGNAAAKAPPKDEPAPARGPTAMEVAIGSLAGAATLDQLAAIWGGLPRPVQGETTVLAAKDKRKAQLQSPADLGGDDIPY